MIKLEMELKVKILLNGLGWIFGKWYGNNNPSQNKKLCKWNFDKRYTWIIPKNEHSVNYLESHDGYTLGDFIRLGLERCKKDEIIKDVDKNVKLTPTQLKLKNLQHYFLLTSRGMTMISEGQGVCEKQSYSI